MRYSAAILASLLAYTAIVGASCYDYRDPNLPNEPVDPETTQSAPNCDLTCQHWVGELHCEGDAPNQPGSCADVCKNAEQHGYSFHRACKSKATTCGACP